MRLTIIYDNTSFKEDLKADWGFSALIEIGSRNILFDTGANGEILLNNMEKLNIDPKDIQDVFISHYHWDHTGGLNSFLKENNNVKLWIPPSFRIKGKAKDVAIVKEPTELYSGVYSTGELEGIEQSLCIKTEKGIVVIVGCSHPDMRHILKVASTFGELYGIIGGMHGTDPSSLKGLKLICPTHCTMYKREIKALYPKSYVEGGAGKVIEV